MRECECRRIWARTPTRRRPAALAQWLPTAAKWYSRGLPAGGAFGAGSSRALARARTMVAPLRVAVSLALLEALPEPRHEIDHRRLLALLGFRNLDLFALHLGPDDLHQIRVIVVGVPRRIEWLQQVRDELLGHLELLRSHGVGARKGEV